MRQSPFAVITFLLFLVGCRTGEPEPTPVLTLPGSSSSINTLLPHASNVVIAAAEAAPTTIRRHSSDISTVMDLGGGERIRGGGLVTRADCSQTFIVSKVLAGSVSIGKVELAYGFVEKTDALPGPRREDAVPVKTKVILFLDSKGRILKATPDNTENRNLVVSELKKAKGNPCEDGDRESGGIWGHYT